MDIGVLESDTSDLQSLAATSFRDRTHAFLVFANENGTITGNHWDPAPYAWAGPRNLDLQDSPETKFSTVAMTADAWLYGISNGKVVSYEMDTNEPYKFYYRGEVS
jgi:hypothetical protein